MSQVLYLLFTPPQAELLALTHTLLPNLSKHINVSPPTLSSLGAPGKIGSPCCYTVKYKLTIFKLRLRVILIVFDWLLALLGLNLPPVFWPSLYTFMPPPVSLSIFTRLCLRIHKKNTEERQAVSSDDLFPLWLSSYLSHSESWRSTMIANSTRFTHVF